MWGKAKHAHSPVSLLASCQRHWHLWNSESTVMNKEKIECLRYGSFGPYIGHGSDVSKIASN